MLLQQGSEYSAFLHDVVYMYLLVLNEVLANNEDHQNGTLMFNRALGKTFEGMNGKKIVLEYTLPVIIPAHVGNSKNIYLFVFVIIVRMLSLDWHLSCCGETQIDAMFVLVFIVVVFGY